MPKKTQAKGLRTPPSAVEVKLAPQALVIANVEYSIFGSQRQVDKAGHAIPNEVDFAVAGNAKLRSLSEASLNARMAFLRATESFLGRAGPTKKAR